MFGIEQKENLPMVSKRLYHVIVLFVTFLAIGPALAGAMHQNQILLTKPSPKALHFEFLVSPALFLHQVMQPRMEFTDFLKTYATLPEADFQKSLEKALRKVKNDNFIHLSSGAKLSLIRWTLPEASTLQTILQKNLLLLELPPQIQAHMEPIVFSASVQSKINLGRIRLTLSPIFYPILVQYQQDLVWFTPHITEALIDL